MTIPMPTYDPTNAGNRPGDGPMRAGGETRSTLPGQSSRDLPSTLSKAASAMVADVALVRDCWAGNAELHRKGRAYLPQAPGEDPANYAIRLQRAVYFNVFRNTVSGLVGYVFRDDPELGDDVPPAIVGQWENIDNAGTHGDVFLRERMTDAMAAGHGAIFVEHPATGGQQSAGQEARGEIRPYWIPILKENILSWRTTVEYGKTILTQLVLYECHWVDDGDFGQREQKRYRVLYRTRAGATITVGFRLLEITEAKAVVEVDAGLYPTQQEIPVAEIRTSGSRGLFESDPPFLDLAYLNLAHYRQWSDYDTGIYATNCPIWTEMGVEPGPDGVVPPIVLGPFSYRRFTDPNAKAGYQSHDGAALGATKQSLDDLKNDMAALGIAALASQKRVAETATAKQLDKGASDSALAVNARALQDAAERALDFHARYLGLDDGGSIEINREYGENRMDPAEMMAWVALAKDLGVPLMFVLERLQDGGRIPEGVDLAAVEQEALANTAAQEAKAQQDRADAVALKHAAAPNAAPPGTMQAA